MFPRVSVRAGVLILAAAGNGGGGQLRQVAVDVIVAERVDGLGMRIAIDWF
jgi:hypothetical protein